MAKDGEREIFTIDFQLTGLVKTRNNDVGVICATEHLLPLRCIAQSCGRAVYTLLDPEAMLRHVPGRRF